MTGPGAHRRVQDGRLSAEGASGPSRGRRGYAAAGGRGEAASVLAPAYGSPLAGRVPGRAQIPHVRLTSLLSGFDEVALAVLYQRVGYRAEPGAHRRVQDGRLSAEGASGPSRGRQEYAAAGGRGEAASVLAPAHGPPLAGRVPGRAQTPHVRLTSLLGGFDEVTLAVLYQRVGYRTEPGAHRRVQDGRLSAEGASGPSRGRQGYAAAGRLGGSRLPQRRRWAGCARGMGVGCGQGTNTARQAHQPSGRG